MSKLVVSKFEISKIVFLWVNKFITLLNIILKFVLLLLLLEIFFRLFTNILPML